MRGGKDKEKVLSPMFPRLHVNDTEKGGPRAPPRNKMALYEQLSIPSQRHISGSASTLPLAPNNTSSSVPSMSSAHGGGHEWNLFTPICNFPALPHLAEKLHSYPSSGVKLATEIASHEGQLIKPLNCQSLNTGGPMPSTTMCDSFQLYNFSNFKNFSWKKSGDAYDLKAPAFAQSGISPHCSSSHQCKDCEKVPQVNLILSQQLQAPSDIQMKGTGTTHMKSRDYLRNRDEKDAKESQSCQDPPGGSASVLSARNKVLVDASSSSLTKVKKSKSLKRSHASLNEQNRRSSVDILNSLNSSNARLNHEFVSMQDNMVFGDNLLVESTEGTGKENASKVRSESCSRKRRGDHNGSLNGPDTEHECHKDKKCGSIRVGGLERRDDVSDTPPDVSDTSTVDSIFALDMSPDDVVRVIGEKLFWKARRAIINQQRIFSVQVFELHRVIKVQKLIAGSPQLLLEDNLYMSKPALNSPLKKFSAVLEPVPIIKPKDRSQKPNLRTECADENTVEKLPLRSLNKHTSKGLITHHSNLRPYTGALASTPVATNSKLSPWCFPHPGNQWLVPVMSPSEGLVYKPYTDPCPLTAGVMGPIHGSCNPVGLTPGCGEFVNTAFGVPPYGMPVMNPSISRSAVEQMSPFTGKRSKKNQLLMGDINFTVPDQSSCNMSNQLSRVIPSYVEKLRESKECEIQGSRASSPSESAEGYVLPLFPTEPTVQALPQNAQTREQQIRVIKVVPHNPRTATESAARIFRSIQEERKLYD